MFFRNRRKPRSSSVAESPYAWAKADDLAAAGDLMGAIDLLTEANRGARDPEIERRIRQLRHVAGIELLRGAADSPAEAKISQMPPIGEQSGVPEVTATELSAGALRASILDKGCLLVRGLMPREGALALADEIDRSFAVRERLQPGEADAEGYYDELIPEPPYAVMERPFVKNGGGVLAVDSPKLFVQMIEAFKVAGLGEVISDYLGESPAISAQKCTLRRSTADLDKAWHQDGTFLGDVKAMNVWLSLSRCGDVAPGLDLVPRRLESHVAAGLEGSIVDIEVSKELADQLAGGDGVKRPIFEPGDALLFDDMFLHSTGSDPSMPNPRYAIESWFFAPSRYPEGYVPIAF